jgi:hypothetical protein
MGFLFFIKKSCVKAFRPVFLKLKIIALHYIALAYFVVKDLNDKFYNTIHNHFMGKKLARRQAPPNIWGNAKKPVSCKAFSCFFFY